jgi:hypothetical protein
VVSGLKGRPLGGRWATRSALEAGGRPSYARAAHEASFAALPAIEERALEGVPRDPTGPFDVRGRALVSVRVAVTVAVNQVPSQGLTPLRSMKVQVNGVRP